MPRPCSVCTHKDAEAINKALTAGEKLKAIADQYGVSKAALSRHRGHMETGDGAPKKLETVPAFGKAVEYDIEALALVCPFCGELELYFKEWLDGGKAAVIVCPWCPREFTIQGLTVGPVSMTLDAAAKVAKEAAMPPWKKKRKR